MPEAILLLRQAVAAAEMGAPLPVDAANWLVAGAQRYEDSARAGEPIGLDVALGLSKVARRGWWYVEAKDSRDALLRELHHRRFPHLSGCDAARAVLALLRRQTVQPQVDHLVVNVLAAGGGLLKVRQMSRILSGTRAKHRKVT